MRARHRALLASCLAVGMAASVAGSGVFAAIFDVEASAQNVLQGGSVDLRGSASDGSTTFIARDVKPCPHPRCEGEGRDVLVNIGKNPGELSIAIKDGDVVNAPGITFEPEPVPDEGELGENAEIAIYLDENNNGVFDGNDTGLSSAQVDPLLGSECVQYAPAGLLYDTINAYEGCEWSNVTELTSGEEDGFAVAWRVPSDVGPEIMDDQVFVKFTFRLDQIQA